MKVGIIGYKGFVGSAFYKVFSADKKYGVTGIDRANYDSLKGLIFDILINANGNSSKRLADSDPALDFGMNVSSTLDFLRDFPTRHYLHISTVEVYNCKEKHELTYESAEIQSAKLSNYGFSKYIGEIVAKKHAKSWMILRLAGMLGKNIEKGPAYDILRLNKLFVSPKSRYQFINTWEVASIAKTLCERGKWGEIYNVVGEGSITLEKMSQMAGVKLKEHGSELLRFNVSVEKLKKEIVVSTTEKTVEQFIKQWSKKQLPAFLHSKNNH